MRSAEAICDLFRERQRVAGTERERMRMMRDLYQGDIAVPLPELGSSDRPAVINFARMGINHMGMRVAGQQPVVEHVPVDFGHREAARKRSDMRRKVTHGWWGRNGQNLILRQRGRWYFAYATSPVLIRPCFNRHSKTYGMPMWEPRSPLDTYPATMAGVTDMQPVDCIFAQTRSIGWLRVNYPDQAVFFHEADTNDLVDVIEYIDHDQFAIVASLAAKRWSEQMDMLRSGATNGFDAPSTGVFLENVPNRAGVPWAVIAGNISLERRTSNYEGMYGMYQAQAKLQALGLIAKQRSVFAVEYLVASGPNAMPQIVRDPDPNRGIMGILRDGTISRWTPDPQYANDASIDRLERSQRVEAGVPASFGGEAASNVRTGKTLSGLVDESVQPLIAEAHEVFARSLAAENEIAYEIDKAYWTDEHKTLFVAFGGDKGKVAYQPSKLWETTEHIVRYPMPGADVHDVNIATGQAIGAGLMSKQTGGRMNPLIDNAEVEHDQIIYERLEDALLQQILTMATTPGAGMELVDMAEMIKRVRNDDIELIDAVLEQQRAAQERQATPVEDPAAQMPGMSPAGAGVEAPPQFQTRPGAKELNGLLMSLRGPQMMGAAEQGRM